MASISLGMANDLQMGAVTWFIVKLFGLRHIFGSWVKLDTSCLVGRLMVASTSLRVMYQTAPFPLTLSHVQGHSHIASIFKCDFSYSSAAVGKTSADLERRAVPLRLAYIAAENNYVTEQRVSAAELFRCYVYILSVLLSVVSICDERPFQHALLYWWCR